MAILAGRWEELRLGCVAGIGRIVVVGLMASETRRGQRCVIGVDVAIGAYPGRHRVRTREGEGCVVVVKGRVRPDRRVMTDFAGCGESRCLMRGIICARIVLLMTGIAERAVQRVVVVDMAVGADPRWHGMRPGQLETGTGVVEGAI